MHLRGLRGLSRCLSTAAEISPRYQTTHLPNGLTVASEYMPGTKTATVGVWINAGSRGDDPKSSGTAHFLEHLSFKGTQRRSQLNLELEVENMGSHINAYTSRENTVYYCKCLSSKIDESVDILSDILTKSKLDPRAIENEKDVILQESDEVGTMYDEVVFDHLHSIAYKNQDLGRTILGPREIIKIINRDNLVDYITTNYRGDKMALVGVGDVNHQELVDKAKKYFSNIKLSEEAAIQSNKSKPIFYGDELRIQDSSMPVTHIALAVESASWSAPDFFLASVASGIIGHWDRSFGVGSNSPSPLAIAASTGGPGNQPIANSFMAYTTSYADTGLMGVYFTADKDSNLKLFTDAFLKELNRFKSGDITEEEVNRSKSQLKASLVLVLDDTTSIAEEIGGQLVNIGYRVTPEEYFEKVEAITKDDIVEWANDRLKNKPIALAALGNVDTLPPHLEIQAGLA